MKRKYYFYIFCYLSSVKHGKQCSTVRISVLSCVAKNEIPFQVDWNICKNVMLHFLNVDICTYTLEKNNFLDYRDQTCFSMYYFYVFAWSRGRCWKPQPERRGFQLLPRGPANESPHNKTNNVAVCPAKTQISLGRKLGSLATHWAHSEDSDQTGRMPRLIWVFAGRIATSLVLSWGGSNVNA